MLTQNWNTKPFSESYSLELPDINKQAAKEIYKLSKGILLTDSQLSSFWRVFKIEAFDGENWYPSPAKAYTHFIRWIRTQLVIPQATTTKEIRETNIILNPLDAIRMKYQKAPRSVTCEQWDNAFYEVEKLCWSPGREFISQLNESYATDKQLWRKAYAMKYFDNL